jgi:hypothetical protein
MTVTYNIEFDSNALGGWVELTVECDVRPITSDATRRTILYIANYQVISGEIVDVEVPVKITKVEIQSPFFQVELAGKIEKHATEIIGEAA